MVRCILRRGGDFGSDIAHLHMPITLQVQYPYVVDFPLVGKKRCVAANAFDVEPTPLKDGDQSKSLMHLRS